METKLTMPLFAFFYSDISFKNEDYNYLLLNGQHIPYTICISSYNGEIPVIPKNRKVGDEKFLGFFELNVIKIKEFFEQEEFSS